MKLMKKSNNKIGGQKNRVLSHLFFLQIIKFMSFKK